jgi:hypothetical protein
VRGNDLALLYFSVGARAECLIELEQLFLFIISGLGELIEEGIEKTHRKSDEIFLSGGVGLASLTMVIKQRLE